MNITVINDDHDNRGINAQALVSTCCPQSEGETIPFVRRQSSTSAIPESKREIDVAFAGLRASIFYSHDSSTGEGAAVDESGSITIDPKVKFEVRSS